MNNDGLKSIMWRVWFFIWYFFIVGFLEVWYGNVDVMMDILIKFVKEKVCVFDGYGNEVEIVDLKIERE